MSCKHLVYGWRWKEADPATGRKGIVKKNKHAKPGFLTEPAVRPCGGCVDCRLDKSRQWAIRSMHEAKSHENNCVITLTYDNQNLPPNKSINPDHAVEFMKKLRAHEQYIREQEYMAWHPKYAIKTYGCAEYGEKYGRPHYHIILFNYSFKDAKPYGQIPGYYTSDILDRIWKKGQCQIMDLTFDSAAYVARYVMKKMTGKMAEQYGEKLPEQSICLSQKGIGKEWYKKNKHKIYTNDIIHINGKQIKPVKYYDKQYEIEHTEKYQKIKETRKEQTKKHIDKIHKQIVQGDNTNNWNRFDRQRAHERCMEAKAELLKRTVE